MRIAPIDGGDVLDLEGPELVSALSSGQFGPVDEKIVVRHPERGAYEIPSEDLMVALSDGWAPETSAELQERQLEQRGTEAFAAGAARGLSMGMSDSMLTEYGVVDSQTLSDLKRANPGESTAGEIVESIRDKISIIRRRNANPLSKKILDLNPKSILQEIRIRDYDHIDRSL